MYMNTGIVCIFIDIHIHDIFLNAGMPGTLASWDMIGIQSQAYMICISPDAISLSRQVFQECPGQTYIRDIGQPDVCLIW